MTSAAHAARHITDAERAAFDRDGFISIAEPVLRERELAATERMLLGELASSLGDRTFHDLAAGPEEAPQIHEVVHVTRRAPALRRGAAFVELRRLAAELLDTPRVRLHFDHAILKPAHNGAPTGWHQDLAFDPDTDGPMATIWLSFCDVASDSGCMQYLPGSHRAGLLEHHPSGRHGLAIDDVDPGSAVTCPLPRGGVSIHGAWTVHGSSPNDSDTPRLAWVTKFVPETRGRTRVAASSTVRRVRDATTRDRSWLRRPDRPLYAPSAE